jgi:hypothetical protein
MANYSERIERSTQKVFFLPTPSNWAEVSKMLAGVQQYLIAASIPNRTFDDVVTVESDGEEIRFIVDLGTEVVV